MIDYDLAWHSALLALLRGLDLLTTFWIHPKMGREINPIYRRLGWRWTIIINLAIVAFAYRWQPFYWACVVVTALVTMWNVSILIIEPALRLDMLASFKKLKWKKRVRRMKVKRLTK